jgi:hypothetical protein
MTFANPLMLWGTTAALIPLLIHLFDRRRPRQVPFGAIAFVLRSQKRTASRLRLKRLLLYVLRTLFLLAVPIALARPELTRAETATAARGAAATAVLIDTSFALRWKDGSTPLFDEAKAQAKAALAELMPEEPATVVACTRSPQALSPLTFERARLIGLVDDVKPSFEVADLNRCIETAAHALAESPLAGRRLVVVSAFTQTALHLELPPPSAPGPKGEAVKPEVVLRDVASGKDELANHAVIDARAEQAPQAGPGAWQFTFTVKNFGKSPAKDLPLQLKVNGAAVAKGFVDLPAHGTAQKALVYRFPQGGVFTVEGALAPDALPEDDVRAMAVAVPRVSQALLVNGSPSPQKHKDEAFFMDAALSASGSPVRAVVRDADAAWREDFTSYDLVALLNVPAPPPEVAQKLEAFVSKGGGLFISAGDRVEADAWNASMGALLPKKVRVVKTAVEPGAPDAQTRAARLAHISTEHPVFAPFTGRAREGLLSTRFERYLLFESDSQPGTEVLGTLDDGAPAFLTARHGKGRVFVFASTVDADWCDLPIRTGFLPLAQRLAAWLTGGLDEREEVKAHVGQTVTLAPEAGVKVSAARAASGVELVAQTVPNSTSVTVGPLPEPGRYVVLDGAGKPLDALTFAATLDPSVSDTARLKSDEVANWFGEDTVRTASGGGPERKTPAWTWLLVIAALAFSLEGLLLRE